MNEDAERRSQQARSDAAGFHVAPHQAAALWGTAEAPHLRPVPSAGPDTSGVDRAVDIAERLAANLQTVVRGKPDQIRLVLTAMACEGHVLFEDVPGTAKTMLARAISGSIEGAECSRIQCTPDLQPMEVTGMPVFNQLTRDFEFRPGPVFAHVVLVDEINRAMPKAQSALFEAMAERQVTADGTTRALPRPFFVLATENPIEHEGTFPLPEAQLDRFFLRTTLGYPRPEDELQIVLDQRHGHPLDALRPAVTIAEVRELQRTVEDVYIDRLLQGWIVDLVGATRSSEVVELGASVRGTLALERAARAFALLCGRAHVEPEDVETLFLPVLGHRMLFTTAYAAATRTQPPGEALARFRDLCLERVPRPSDRVR
jgi:MoxR-like ATPase